VRWSMYRSMFDCASLPMVGRWSRRESRPRCGLRAEGGGCGQRQARGGFGGGKAYPPPFERWDKLCVGKQRTPLCPGMPLLLEGSLRGLREGSF
jgi:hypothetical protein